MLTAATAPQLGRDYKIVKYTPEYLESVARLERFHWGPQVEWNAEYIRWKYHQNPYLKDPTLYLALYRDEVVGARGLYGSRWEAGTPSESAIVAVCGDAVIHPDHRARGLLRAMTQAGLEDMAARGLKYAFNFSAGPQTFLTSLGMGWCNLGLLGRHRRVSDQPQATTFFQRMLRKYKAPLKQKDAHPFHTLDQAWEKRNRNFSKSMLCEKTPRPQAMAYLINRLGNDGRLRHVRDETYFSWRFRSPFSCYRFLFWKDHELEGYLVMQRSARLEKLGVRIVDWEATNEHVYSELLKAATQLVGPEHLVIWFETLSEEKRSCLNQNHFEPWPMKNTGGHISPTILVISVHPEERGATWRIAGRELLDMKNWDIRMIYSDGF